MLGQLSVLGKMYVGDLIFIQDGAPPHFVIFVRKWLNAQFPQKGWIALVHTTVHPKVLTLAVNTLGLFCLGLVEKTLVYSNKPRNLEEIEGRIREFLTSIAQELLVKSVNEVFGRLRLAGGE